MKLERVRLYVPAGANLELTKAAAAVAAITHECVAEFEFNGRLWQVSAGDVINQCREVLVPPKERG